MRDQDELFLRSKLFHAVARLLAFLGFFHELQNHPLSHPRLRKFLKALGCVMNSRATFLACHLIQEVLYDELLHVLYEQLVLRWQLELLF